MTIDIKLGLHDFHVTIALSYGIYLISAGGNCSCNCNYFCYDYLV